MEIIPGLWAFSVQLFISVIVLAFLCKLLDSSMGMGYGTTLTPILMIAGFGPLAIVPCILLSDLITGLTAGLAHHKAGNVNFKRGSFHLKIALALAACSIIGVSVAVAVAINIPKLWLKTYIGLLVLGVGILMLLTFNKTYKFSWKKITGLGLVAAFNKGMSGGGYGPVTTGGQILSGINGNNAVGITSLSKGLTCAIGVLVFIVSPEVINWNLAPPLIIGGMLSVPLSMFIVKNLRTKTLKIAIASLTLILGTFTLFKIFY